jgi:ribose-phosphate pyrophosphokinase
MSPAPSAGPSPCLFALAESREAGDRVALEAGIASAPLEERRFEGGEFKLRPLESVRGRTAFVFESLAGTEEYPVAERLVRLLFLLGVLRDAGAVRRVAVIPYLAFARKERRTQVRDPVNTRYVAQLLEAAGADHLVALDVHNPAALDNAFRIPVDHLSALPMMADHFARQCGAAPIAVLSPDVGGVKRAQLFRELLEARLGRAVDLAFVEKRRALDVVSGGTLVGMASNQPTVIVLDDLCATGGTLTRAAEICREAGAAAVHVAITHAPLRTGIEVLLRAAMIDRIVVTDSVGAPWHPQVSSAAPAGRLVTLPVAPLLGQALGRMVSGRPLAPLLRHWPVAPEG